ncbi:hypothetical protein COY62_04270 [bacterium (Candidatus Howlettbacteria) CG_4_10_14_0_8_um_filter_40_9]|nr:MAG: hypothetical protein COY62_04270 [bacterium (Candidatus Howlettbacteria) CG_4_10_14_0_8_um_filter_40_9]
MKAKAFSIILLSFVAGIFVAPFFDIDTSLLKYIALGIFIISLLFFRKNIWIRTALISLAVFLFAIFRYGAVQPEDNPAWIGHYNGKKVEIVGVVDSEPEKDIVTKFVVDVLNVDGKKDVSGKIMVTVRNYPAYKFGDKIKISGELKEPPAFEDFSYKDYLSRFGIFSVMDFPDVEKTAGQYVERGTFKNIWFGTRVNLNSIRKTFESGIEKTLPEPHASFMTGLILGSKKSIPEWLLEDFKKTGTTHIIALSGFNITIIVMVLKNLTHGFSRRLSFWLPILGVFLFVLLTGAQASVVRAAIMGSMLLLATRLGRQSNAFVSIAFTAVIMIYLNPLILRFDIGFQLSFAALVGLIYVAPFIDKYFLRFPKIIAENLSLTLAAQIAAAPIIIYNFKSLSLIAPVANVLILPLIPLVMAVGFVSTVMAIVFEPLGRLFGYVSYGFLEYMIRVAGYLSSVSLVSIDIDMKSPIYILVYYFLLFDIYLILSKRKIIKEKEYER